jgi:lipoprotein-anchoring transpeptidase ErfK/SrfK
MTRAVLTATCAFLSFVSFHPASAAMPAAGASPMPVAPVEIKVSVKDQKLALYQNGLPVRVYGVSTSKFGIGDSSSSYRTPAGKMTVADKIGGGQPAGMVFKGRRATGEVLAANAPGRDPIVSRILWLTGTEATNNNAYGRCIYIHGTPEERNIGRPSSYGCIRMRSMDVIDLYNRVSLGTQVTVTAEGLPRDAKRVPEYVWQRASGAPPATAFASTRSAAQTAGTPAVGRLVPLSSARILTPATAPYVPARRTQESADRTGTQKAWTASRRADSAGS